MAREIGRHSTPLPESGAKAAGKMAPAALVFLVKPVIFSGISDDKEIMRPWIDDFSACGLDEILRFQAENREWSKQLRLRTATLVNSRLAKDVSQDDYLASRKTIHEDTAECRSRANILDAQIARHSTLVSHSR
jgi:hypothetical protein